jgi:cold shock CspA family protein
VNKRTYDGYIKTYLFDRGFGFLRATNPALDSDVFFHISNLPDVRQVNEGDLVQFNVAADEKSGRNKAVDIVLVL